MQRTIRFMIAAFFAWSLCTAGILGPQPATAEAPLHLQLQAISFADSRDGWVSGYSGTHAYLFHTADGGHTWSEHPVQFRASQMQFITAQVGWALGSPAAGCTGITPCRDVLAFTDNAGRSWLWQIHAPACTSLYGLDVVTRSDGWVIEGPPACPARSNERFPSRLMRTSDGGSTWQAVVRASAPWSNVHFGDRRHGWFAVGGAGSDDCSTAVYSTADAGMTWKQAFRLRWYCQPRVDFVDRFHGWLLVTNMNACSMGGCYDNRLYRSLDGGRHWSLEQRSHPQPPALWSGPSGFLGDLHFVTPETGYMPVAEGAGPGQGGIDITHDGGLHWIRKRPFKLQVLDVTPIDAQHAWAIGCTEPEDACSFLLYTGDGGRTWRRLRRS